MPSRFQRITPFLWFDRQAEEAVAFYVSVFEHSRILATTRFTASSAAASGQPEGSVMTIDFELDGQRFAALNGGPQFRFNEAVSLVVNCRSQEEIDYYWDRLGTGGDERARQCGWLKDRYGLSWQVVPEELTGLLTDGDAGKAARVVDAIMRMQKLDLAELRRAAAG
ncbi:VOC family protein [Dyella sedimenti]|uniref:VOC family protein n=1 Tax=Dyella sedimenti TaxID=2919947 RepID=UPI001FAA0F04|nr:VOC family protein [Dyella sedimenti]